MTITELKGERVRLVKEARSLLDKAEAEKRAMTAEENKLYEAKMADVDKFQSDIEQLQKQDEYRKKLALMDEDEKVPEPIRDTPKSDRKSDSDAAIRELRQYLLTGKAEGRALQMDSDPAGGYVVAPQQFVARLIEAAKNRTFVRGLASVFSVPNAQSLGAPALDSRPADPTWTAELAFGAEDTTMDFAKRELRPHPLAQYIKVSKKLIRASALNVENIVADQLGYKAAVVEENAFLNGSGVNQPLGVFTASAQGIDTDRDVSTGNTITEIRCDGLIEAKYHLLPNYWDRARWLFHRDGVKQIRKLKDGEGQYIWRAGIAGDRGDTILDIPVLMSEYVPNTFTTGLYVGILGDFSFYWIADALDMTIQTLTELYALTNQNAYLLRKETDGMPALSEAFIRVALA